MADVPKDPGAGVGKSGVVTPWENGNRKNSEWMTADLGKQGWPETNRKNPSDSGRPWNHPWEKTCDYPAGGSKQTNNDEN